MIDNNVLAPFLLFFSIILQFGAAYLSIRLIKQTVWVYPWVAISGAISLMAVRRIITLSQYLFYDGRSPNLNSESVALLISVLMVVGIGMLGPAFREEKRNVTNKTKILEKTQKRAEKANLSKSEYLAAMSHDLRTPLNAIIGFSEVIKMEMFGSINNKKYTDYINDIYGSSVYLLQLVNDILDVSTLESGEKKLFKELIYIKEPLDESIRQLNILALTKNINLKINTPSNLAPVFADRKAIMQIIMNIIGNSIKFTPCGGKVVVTLKVSENNQIIEVVDTGVGISKGDIENITLPFVRAKEDPYLADKDGTGLGLSIAKGLIILHEGAISIKSETNKGTVVTITIPQQNEKNPSDKPVG